MKENKNVKIELDRANIYIPSGDLSLLSVVINVVLLKNVFIAYVNC
ncbi:hypothetical protein [Clostridium kluyveri]|nr:hypothetical protein [Clostridium kluyveri]